MTLTRMLKSLNALPSHSEGWCVTLLLATAALFTELRGRLTAMFV
jgi:hypothetical protein